MTTLPYMLTEMGISFVFEGRSRVVAKDHTNFAKIKEAVQTGNTTGLRDLFDLKGFVVRISNGSVQLSDNEVRVKGVAVPDYLAQRILEHNRNGEAVDSICRFAEKLVDNPNKDVIEDLFKWLEIGKMPIFEDGDVLGFKKVRADYRSIHTNTKGQNVLQAIGTVVEMPRSECDENRNSTCSTGLHFCSYEYLPNFGTGGESRIIIVKINPKDVTAIPTDYNLTKGRCSRFEVVGEVPEDEAKTFFGGRTVVTDFGTVKSEKTKAAPAKKSSKKATKVSQSPKRVKADRPFVNTWGTSYTAKEVLKTVNAKGRTKTAAAGALGVSRSTLARWVEKAESLV